MPKNDELKKLKKELFYKPKEAWCEMSDGEKKRAQALAKNYIDFISSAKTERESARAIVELARSKGFDFKGRKKIWFERDRVVALAVEGKRSAKEGLRIIASHIDAPRLDLKARPLYEDSGLALVKTHYYGGLKKYQWVSRPLALHGRIMTKEKVIDVAIGEGADDPVFCVADLEPHLSANVQNPKKITEAIPAEKLNIVVGGFAIDKGEEKERIRLQILKLLRDRYGILESDLITADLEAVPVGRAREVGFDGALIGGYGHDDRSCAFSSFSAILDVDKPEMTCLALFIDKEEIGSEGNTSGQGIFAKAIVADILGQDATERGVDEALYKSFAISADVGSATNPDYSEVHDPKNASQVGWGTIVEKYTGHRGKYDTSEASAEYLSWLIETFDTNKVVWHIAELGKVDEGGGGTLAKFFARLGPEVVDVGIPVLAMHSPFELVHKADLYMAYKGYKAFFSAPFASLKY